MAREPSAHSPVPDDTPKMPIRSKTACTSLSEARASYPNVYPFDRSLVEVNNMEKKAVLITTLCAMIVVVIFFQFILFNTSLPKDYTTYYSEFNKTPTLAYNYSLSPPVSVYQALLIALNSRYWNRESLENFSVYIELDYWAYFTNLSPPNGVLELGGATYRSTGKPISGTAIINTVTQPPADWLPQQIDNITYRYVWTINVQYVIHPNDKIPIVPSLPFQFQVDAATAELIEP